MSRRATYLDVLSDRQKEAVTSDPSVPLQILAGPGSGKTRVLTTRIAHIIEHHYVPPQDICAVTFTNKAAKEMKDRLGNLLGDELASKLIMGTFHSVCVRYLRRFSELIGLPKNFIILDPDDCAKVIKRRWPQYAEKFRELAQESAGEGGGEGMKEEDFKEKWCLNEISRSKAKGLEPRAVRKIAIEEKDPKKALFADIYEEYENELKDNHSLDFDDLLSRGMELFKTNPHVLFNIKHIFIDEFQDTNHVQYTLAELFAGVNKNITIVGDPDQSIYGWRSAEIENLNKMMRNFSGCKQIFLEENYRSTGSILAAASAVISQDVNRINKGLFTNRAKGEAVVLKRFSNDDHESNFIAKEIKRLKVAYALRWDDFAVLLRYNAQSRGFEKAMQTEGIPNRILNGHKFFQRAEIMLVIGYLQLVENEAFGSAFRRVVNAPKRGLGEKSIDRIVASANNIGASPIKYLRQSRGDLNTKQAQEMKKMIEGLDTVRASAKSGSSVMDLIDLIVHVFELKAHFMKEDDWESRMENIDELKTFASKLTLKNESTYEIPTQGDSDDEIEEVVMDTPLRMFLEEAMLSTDADETADKDESPKVLLSTVHQAKGLEWPVVFIPTLEMDIYPFFRSKTPEQIDEERHAAVVSMTRAQALLYSTHVESRFAHGKSRASEISPFLPPKHKWRELFLVTYPIITSNARITMAKILDRPEIDEKVVLEAMASANIPHETTDEYYLPYSAPTTYSQSGGSYFSRSNKGKDEYALPPMMDSFDGGFSKASTLVGSASTFSSSTVSASTSSTADRQPRRQLPGANSVPSSTTSSLSTTLPLISSSSSSSSPSIGSFRATSSRKINNLSSRTGSTPVFNSTFKPPSFINPPPSASPANPTASISSTKTASVPSHSRSSAAATAGGRGRGRQNQITAVARRRAALTGPPRPDPPKWAPPRQSESDRYKLPPMKSTSSKSADPSILLPDGPGTGLDRFVDVGSEGLSIMKTLGLSSSTPPTTAASSASQPSIRTNQSRPQNLEEHGQTRSRPNRIKPSLTPTYLIPQPTNPETAASIIVSGSGPSSLGLSTSTNGVGIKRSLGRSTSAGSSGSRGLSRSSSRGSGTKRSRGL
ncbi:atp-dependent dna helicase pcra [Phaffia rhodozyma]|uniref:DNA 3'-5' helicase n=1 Tax=Phaffia rhodozyma TaxID=264483 RepID=A0A0F7SEY2_PHARH|nr:atp-dependent dna helicase pcra [Phaffia rhodozyma]